MTTRIDQIRQDAAARFAELGLPATRNEDWRFTSVARIAKMQFSPAPTLATEQIDNRLSRSLGVFDSGESALRLVSINGRYSAGLSSRKIPQGIRVTTLRDADGAIRKHLASYASYRDQAFVAWNTARFEDVLCVEIPKGTVVEEPIELVFLTAGGIAPAISYPRALVVVGSGSQATIVERYAGEGNQYFTNAVTEIVADERSVVDHYKLQEEDENAFHIATFHVELARDASFSTHSISLGGGLVRNDVHARLAHGTEAIVNGFYLTSGDQHVDNHTEIDHAQPHGTSHELYKGILGGRSAAVFNGKIIVRPGAQKTDARQTNKNLVLSEDATINSKPELQIYADDVRCTHGATIGQLDRDAIFYLQSRGIGQEQAGDILTSAFARDVIDRVKLAPLRAHVEQTLLERLHAHRN